MTADIEKVAPRDPIFIGGAPSSGTTLLRAIVNRHPNIVAGDETGLLAKRSALDASAAAFRGQWRAWMDNGLPRLFTEPDVFLFESTAGWGWSADDLPHLCENSPDYGTMLRHFFLRSIEQSRKRRWAEKTPSNVGAFASIQRHFPDAKFIHAVRDGRDCVASYAARGRDSFHSVGRWFVSVMAGLAMRGNDACLEVRYENLVREPEQAVRCICAFLEEPFYPSMIESGGQFLRQHRTWAADPAEPISAASVGRYRNSLCPEHASFFRYVRLSDYGKTTLPFPAELGEMSALELQRYLGYGTDLLENASPLTCEARRAAAQEVEDWRVQMRYRFSLETECEVSLGQA